jgi:hypothetical protein
MNVETRGVPSELQLSADTPQPSTPGGRPHIRPSELYPISERSLSCKLAGLAVLLGIVLRTLQYLGNRSIWLDEALLLPTIVETGWSEILNPFRTSVVPLGFLAVQKAAIGLFDDGEYVLRFLPLLAGILSVVLFLLVARRLLTPTAVPTAVGLFAFSPFLIYYASELKQYSSDVAIATAVLLLALRLKEEPTSWSRLGAWGVFSVAAVSISLTSVFVIAGVGATLIAWLLTRKEYGAAIRWTLVSIPSAILFLMPYLTPAARGGGSSATDGSDYMGTFWQSGFMPLPPRSAEDWMWFPHAILRTFQDPLGLLHSGRPGLGIVLACVGIVAFAAGCTWFLQTDRPVLLLLLAPILLTLLASGLKRYPFGGDWNTAGRVILFLSPFFLLLIAEGADRIRLWLPQKARVLGIALMVALVAPSAVQAAATVPYGRGELKPLLSYVQEHWRSGDVLYVHYDAIPAFRYYAPRYGLDSASSVEGVCARFEPVRYLEALESFRGERRVWILFTAGLGARLFNERALMVDYLEHVGTRLDDRVARGTFVYLFDLTPKPDVQPFSARIPVIPVAVEEGCDLWR